MDIQSLAELQTLGRALFEVLKEELPGRPEADYWRAVARLIAAQEKCLPCRVSVHIGSPPCPRRDRVPRSRHRLRLVVQGD
jgi:hypothetical protein